MEEHIQAEDTHWDQVMESLDLLFARVTDIGRDQQQIRAQLGQHTDVLQGYAQAQEVLTQKVDAASQAVAKLTPDFVGFDSARQPSSPQPGPSGENNYQRNQFHFGRPNHDQSGGIIITSLSSRFRVLMVVILKSGVISAWIIFIFAMFLSICGSRLLRYIWMIMRPSGFKCTS